MAALYLDRHLCIRKFTPSLTRITNLRDVDLGRPLYHLSVSDAYAGLLDDIQQVARDLQPLEKEILTASGAPYLMRIVPYRTEDNAVDGVLVTFVDISRLKRESTRANQAIQRLQLALEMGRMAWWDWDIASGEVVADSKKATMLGYRVHEFPTNVYKICALIHPDDYDTAMQAMRDHLSGVTSTYEVTYRIRTKDGGYRWYSDRGGIVARDAQGRPLRVAGIVIDVTPQKLLEVGLRHQHDVMLKLLESSALAALLVDAEGRIVYANQRAESVLGADGQQLRSLTFNATDWVIEDMDGHLLPAEQYPFATIMHTMQPFLDRHFLLHLPGGNAVPLVMHGSPTLSVEGRLAGAIFVMEMAKDE
ncbi:MAG TPA: hypothetical protein DCL15_17830 [Chloroflexi bacterium]|nr:hypothetical protein [Chloroflexota bacterium]HHW87243.1 PAS domain-containing protein [Chloroflexota bacterium]